MRGSPAVELQLVASAVRVVGEQLLLDFGALAQTDTDYSLVLPAEAVVDWSGNGFQGLVRGDYIFRTSQPAADGSAGVSAEDSGLSVFATAGIVAGAAAGTLLVTRVALRCLRRAGPTGCSEPQPGQVQPTTSCGKSDLANSASLGVSWILGSRAERPPGASPELGAQRAAVVREGWSGK